MTRLRPRRLALLSLLLPACTGDIDVGALTVGPTTVTAGEEDTGDDEVGDDETGPLLDFGGETATAETGTDPAEGCKGVDFLFVVDNSGSMGPRQEALVESYPSFIDAMQVQLAEMGAESIQVMVTDTDTRAVLPRDPQCDILCSDQFFMGTCPLTQIDCAFYGPECFGECMQDLTGTCGPNDEFSCVDMTGCDDSCECELGSGIIQDKVGNDCGITGDSRFMEPDQPDPHETFSCIAAVGTSGTGGERPIGSMLTALADSNNQDGGCNAGFLRDDAILVVTIVTDEDDDNSDLNPPAWIDELRATKANPEEAIVVLGLISDYGLPGATCLTEDGDDGAEAAPRLQSFVNGMDRSMTGSICADSYGDFFAEAIDLIDLACEEFTPIP